MRMAEKVSKFAYAMEYVYNALKEKLFILIPAVMAFYLPYIHAIAILFILMFVDTYWGIKTAKFEKKKIRTNRAMDFFAKLIGYGLFIAVGIFLDMGLKIPYIVWIIAFVPASIELISINEKQIICGKKGIFSRLSEVYKFALNIKQKRDKLR